MDDELDTHLCLVCQETIYGLMNYVAHKKSGCQKKSSFTRPPDMQEGTFSNDAYLLYGHANQRGSTSSRTRDLHNANYSPNSQDNFVLSSFHHDSRFGHSYPHHHNSHSASDHAYNALQPNSGHNSSSLDVDVTSPLSSFIESAFSPSTDSPLNPNSVLHGTGSSQSNPDFFQSLELERKGREKTAESGGRNYRNRRKGLPEIDVDLPITMILSNLDFSSDEETGVVAFPSDGSDLDASDSEWMEPQPPRSHTGGKWKPGERPAKSYHPHQPTGGKWRPGQVPIPKRHKRSNNRFTRPFYCNTCKLTFTDRLSYSVHTSSVEHREAEEIEKNGKSSNLKPEPKAASVPSVTLDPSTGEMMEVMVPLHTKDEAGIVKRRQNNVAVCETCDLYFDSIKVYDMHCETKQHKENLAKKTQEVHELMLGTSENTQTVEQKSLLGALSEDKTDEIPSKPIAKSQKPLPETHYCVMCKKKFARKYEMARHLLTQFHRQRAMKHPQALEILNKYNKYVIRLCPYQCNVCQFYFNRPSDLLDHLQSSDHVANCQDLVGPLLCVTCKYKTSSLDQILDHVRSQPHKLSVARNHHVCIIRESHSKITCKYCGVQMHSAVRMKRHIKYRHKDRKIQDNLQIHTREKPIISCPDCIKTFHSQYDLKKHFQCKHASKEKPFHCEICIKKFMSIRSFASHKETAMHKRRLQEHQLAVQYIATVVNSGSDSATEEVAKNPVASAIKGKVIKEKKRRKRKAMKPKASLAVSRPRRAVQRPKRYFGSDGSSNEDMNENTVQMVNSSDNVSQAIEKVLEIEKYEKSHPSSVTAENCLLGIDAVDVGQVENVDQDNDLEDVLGAISKDIPEHPAEADLLNLDVKKDIDHNDHDANGDHNDLEAGGGHSDHEADGDNVDLVNGVKEGMTEENTGDPDCGKTNPKNSAVKKLKIFNCQYCSFTGADMKDLQDHTIEQHPKEVVTCQACSQIFLAKKAYKIHCAGSFHQKNLSRAEIKEELYICSFCGRKHTDEKSHELHVEFAHKHVSTEEGISRVIQGRDLVTQLYGEHLKQLKNVSFRTSVSCPECGRFFQKNNLIEHLRSHTGERPYKCRHCGKTFSSPNALRRHLIDHIGFKPIPCDECDQTFKKQSIYALHMKMHANKKNGIKFDCDVCGATFYVEKMLNQHLKRHGDRKFKCKIEGCHWSFVLKAELEEHMFTHTREKKYLCDICGFEAGTKTRIRRHVKTHEPAKKIACEYCNYKGSCYTHLKRHMRIHMGIKPFKCLYCAYECNTAENIRKHILHTRKHQGLKLYPCRFCEFKSNCAKEFKQHLHQYHMEYIKMKASEPLVVFTGLYRPEEDITEPPEGGKIHQVMKGRFVKIYDGSRLGTIGEAVGPPKKKSKISKRVKVNAETESETVSEQETPPFQIQPKDSEDGDPISIMLNEDSSDAEDASSTTVPLVNQQEPEQQPSTNVQTLVYPRGLPWTLVTPHSRPEAWIHQGQMLDVVVPQPCRVQDLHVVCGNQATGTTTFISNAGIIPNILTTISVDSTVYPQLEPGTYQVIAQASSDIPVSSVSIVNQN